MPPIPPSPQAGGDSGRCSAKVQSSRERGGLSGGLRFCPPRAVPDATAPPASRSRRPQSAPTQPSTLQRVRPLPPRCCCAVSAAVVGVVDLARPFVGTGGLHAAEQRQADHRPLLQAPGWDSCHRPGGLPVAGSISSLEADDHAADAAAAFADLDPRIAGLRLPDAGRLAVRPARAPMVRPAHAAAIAMMKAVLQAMRSFLQKSRLA